ncbi:MAG: hypothetical protein MUF34_31000 [Polyangiaceae bacterium]|jgi:hypothetical protein|nr:hypothetical protein [Polyangiaceae bacterium]
MKLAFITVLAAMSFSLLGCEEKKPEAKPATTPAAATPAAAPAAPASAKPGGGGW